MVLQAILKKKRVNTQALLAEANRQAGERERVLEERKNRLLEEDRNRSDVSYRAIYELLVASFSFTLAKSCT